MYINIYFSDFLIIFYMYVYFFFKFLVALNVIFFVEGFQILIVNINLKEKKNFNKKLSMKKFSKMKYEQLVSFNEFSRKYLHQNW